ncbi:hypothetical protein ACWEV3_41585 [Saccharopolyspora sp. NPDC003752]
MRHPHSQVLPGGFGYPLGFASGFVVTAACIPVGDAARPAAAAIGLAILVAVVSAVTTVPAAAATTAVCWGFYDTFAIGVRGDLTFDQAAAVGLGVLVCACAVGLVAGAVSRARRRHATLSDVPFVPAPRQGSSPLWEKLSH